jgi:transposase
MCLEQKPTLAGHHLRRYNHCNKPKTHQKKKLTEVQKKSQKKKRKKKKKVVAVGRRWQNRDRRVKTVLFSLVLIFKTVCQTYVDHGLGFQNGQRNT